jgi:hypothetical protein
MIEKKESCYTLHGLQPATIYRVRVSAHFIKKKIERFGDYSQTGLKEHKDGTLQNLESVDTFILTSQPLIDIYEPTKGINQKGNNALAKSEYSLKTFAQSRPDIADAFDFGENSDSDDEKERLKRVTVQTEILAAR